MCRLCVRPFLQAGFKGFQIAAEKQNDAVSVHYEGSDYRLSHGSVVIAAVTSCTNNCNPSVMLAAGWWWVKATRCLFLNYLYLSVTFTFCFLDGA